ncbi:MAG: glyoxalase/bleomycin resistance/extradiol dioxygenase family protein, partial [Planctomycetales bacterium]|nr:glyoxalase/bleomycin resistance/extradiol dioxygenase family protein [Planctomycetales bacterium]
AASAEEIDGWVDHLTSHRVEIESAFDWPQGGRSIYFRDPAGNSLEFAEPRIWGL